MTPHLTDETLQDLFDDALDPERRLESERHVTGCPDCARALDELEGLRAVLGELPRDALHAPVFAPPDEADRAPAMARDRIVSPPPRRDRAGGAAGPRRAALARAAGIVAVFAGGLVAGAILDDGRGASVPEPTAPADAMEVATAVQRTGTAYAAAVMELGSLAGEPDASFAFAQGREAALSVLYAATLAYAGLEPPDERVGRILEAVEAARRPFGPGAPSTSGF